MADQDHYKTYVRDTHVTESNGTGTALIIGGLVVAVGFILWLVFGGPGPVATSPSVDSTTVTIEPAAPADTMVDPAVPPAPDAVAPAAPADNAAPDAAGTEPAPAPAPVEE